MPYTPTRFERQVARKYPWMDHVVEIPPEHRSFIFTEPHRSYLSEMLCVPLSVWDELGKDSVAGSPDQ
jgi:hypothetical protein